MERKWWGLVRILGMYFLLGCALASQATPTSVPTVAPTATATLTPVATLDLSPWCIPAPQYGFVVSEIWRGYPGAQVPREGAFFFGVRFMAADGEEYLAMFGYGEGEWELVFVKPWPEGQRLSSTTVAPLLRHRPYRGLGERIERMR